MLIYKNGIPTIKRIINDEIIEIELDEDEMTSIRVDVFNGLAAVFLEEYLIENYNEEFAERFFEEEDLADEKIDMLTDEMLDFISSNKDLLVKSVINLKTE